MPNSSGTWKAGERAQETGEYECLNCRLLGNQTRIRVESGKIFPYCTVDNLKDNTYKLVTGRR
jgi:hypothetical protein